MNSEREIEQAFADYQETQLRRLAVAHRGAGPHATPRAGSPSAPTAPSRSPPLA